MKNNNVVKNTTMLYLMNIAKMVFPLLTLPYLTRVLTVDCYGVVSYVKAVMQYMQLIVDFGFVLSGTKDIVLARNDRNKLNIEVGNILIAKLLLSSPIVPKLHPDLFTKLVISYLPSFIFSNNKSHN